MKEQLLRPRLQVGFAVSAMSSGALLTAMPLLGDVPKWIYGGLLLLLLVSGALQLGAAHVAGRELEESREGARRQLESVARQVVRRSVMAYCAEDAVVQTLESDLPWLVRVREADGMRRTLLEADCDDVDFRRRLPSTESIRRSRQFATEVKLSWYGDSPADIYVASLAQEASGGVIQFFYALPSSVADLEGRLVGDLVVQELARDTLIANLVGRLSS